RPRLPAAQGVGGDPPPGNQPQALRVSDPGHAAASAAVAGTAATPGAVTRGEPAPLPPSEVAPRVISAQNAYVMTDMMSDVIKRGTGRRALALGRSDLAGKTGTTNQAKDTWFNGFTPHLVATVWVGFDQENPLRESEECAKTAMPIWIHFMREALKGVPDQPRPVPEGLVTLRVSS